MGWLVIGGAPRSGTTLLFHMLKAHPAIAISNEKQLLQRLQASGESTVSQEYLAVLSESDQPRIRWLGDKVPEYYESDLSACFSVDPPRILHISRRPSAVVASMLHRTRQARRGKDPSWSPWFGVRDAIDTWARAWQFALSQRRNRDFLHVKYEDVLADPRAALDRMTGHLGLPPAPLDERRIGPPESKPLDSRAMRLISRQLGEIDERWDLSLPELEVRFEYLRPASSSGPRRLKRRLLWQFGTLTGRIEATPAEHGRQS